MDRVADETGCEAILVPNPVARIERLLVPVGGEVDVARVAALVGDREMEVTLYHVADSDDAVPAGRSVVDDAAARLRNRGLPAEMLATEATVSGTRVEAMATAATDHDAVVTGESEPSLRSFLFGDGAEQIAARSIGPVVVVRRAPTAPE